MGLFNAMFGRRGPRDPLDDPIAWLSDLDVVRLRDLLKSIAGFGATGSGKSSAVARWIANGILRHPRSSMLILCAKPEDKRDWQRYFAEAGRAADLLVFEPGGELRFNTLDYLLKSGGDCRDVTRCLMALNETLRGGDGSGNDEFWQQQQERAIYNSVVMLKLATDCVSAPHLQRFLTGAANTPADLNSDAWREGFHNQMIRAAIIANKTAEETADFQIAKDYFIYELPSMADKTRSSIMAGVYGLFHALCTGPARTLLSSETNSTPLDMLDRGKSWLVNAAPAMHGPNGKVINAAAKFATQWSVLRRDAKPTDYFNVIFGDESHQFVNSPDSDYLAQCRSHLGCMIYFTQSRQSYYAALGARMGHDKADALLANFNLKIATALGDFETAQWFSNLGGRELRTFFGGSVAPSEGIWETLMGNSKVTSSFNTSFANILEPNVFCHGMRTGGPDNYYLVDAVVVKTGEPFASGNNWMWTSFRQR